MAERNKREHSPEVIRERLRPLEAAAREALVCRDQGYFANEARRPWMLAWTAGVSLVGLFVLGWSAASLWVFIYIGLWGDVLRNALKVLLFKAATDRHYRGFASQQEVWAVSGALLNGNDLDRVRVPEKNTTPLQLLVIDFLTLAVATGIILVIAREREILLLAEFAGNRQLVTVTALTMLAGIILPLWQDRGRNGQQQTILRYEAGGPMIFGWVLMFFFAGIAHEQDDLRTLMLVINAIIVLAIPLAAWSYRISKENTQWLKDQLRTLDTWP